MRIQVYKCKFTKKYFEDKEEFIVHLKKLRLELKGRRRAKRIISKRKETFTMMRNTVTSFSKLEDFIMKNWKYFEANGMQRRAWSVLSGKRRLKNKPKLVSIEFKDMVWSEQVSNTHDCPFNGKTNWGGRDKKVPTGYAGWTGRMEYTFSNGDGEYPRGSELWEHTGINTGTGGGGGKKYGYHIKIFADDWPMLAKVRSQEEMWMILNDQEDEYEYN